MITNYEVTRFDYILVLSSFSFIYGGFQAINDLFHVASLLVNNCNAHVSVCS